MKFFLVILLMILPIISLSAYVAKGFIVIKKQQETILKEISISREREEVIGQTIKQLSYECDVMTKAFLDK